jgi:co-chaperonin GroES (HSP10)
MIKLFGQRALIQYIPEEAKKGTLILPKNEAPQFATVIAVGEDSMPIKAGDKIIVFRFGHLGQEVKYLDHVYMIVEMKEILGKLEVQNAD